MRKIRLLEPNMSVPTNIGEHRTQIVDHLRDHMSTIVSGGNRVTNNRHSSANVINFVGELDPSGWAKIIGKLPRALNLFMRQNNCAIEDTVAYCLRNLFDRDMNFEMVWPDVRQLLIQKNVKDPSTKVLDNIYRTVWYELNGGNLYRHCQSLGVVDIAIYNRTIVEDQWRELRLERTV